jgi:hypothetical protein
MFNHCFLKKHDGAQGDSMKKYPRTFVRYLSVLVLSCAVLVCVGCATKKSVSSDPPAEPAEVENIASTSPSDQTGVMDASAYYNRGTEYFNQKDYDRAIGGL